MLCILLNTIVMALNWFDAPVALGEVAEILNYSFTAVFTLEASIKIVAFKKAYFRDTWNVFDFSIVAFTLGFLSLKAMQVPV